MQNATYARTMGEAKLDLDFAIRLSELHARLYGRLKKGIIFASLVAGSAAVTTFISHSAIVVTLSAILVAAAVTADVVYDLGALAVAHDRDRRRFLKIRSGVAGMTVAQLDAKLARAQANCVPVIESLRMVAYNDNLRTNGLYSATQPETRLQRFMRALA